MRCCNGVSSNCVCVGAMCVCVALQCVYGTVCVGGVLCVWGGGRGVTVCVCNTVYVTDNAVEKAPLLRFPTA